MDARRTSDTHKTLQTKNTQLYKLRNAAGRRTTCAQWAAIIAARITISQWNYHHKNPPYLHIFIWTHINTYSSLSTDPFHHQRNMMTGILPLPHFLSLSAGEQCHRWNSEIHASTGAAVLAAWPNKRIKANKSAFRGWTVSHARSVCPLPVEVGSRWTSEDEIETAIYLPVMKQKRFYRHALEEMKAAEVAEVC